MNLVVRTVRFDGAGVFTCRRCSHEVRFPHPPPEGRSVMLITVDTGATLRVSSARGGIVHECGREHYWWCDDEEVEVDDEDVLVIIRKRGRGLDALTCVRCRGEIRQRVRFA